MQIKITIINPTATVLTALGSVVDVTLADLLISRMAGDGDVNSHDAPPAAQGTPTAAPMKITDVNDLDIGDQVHWAGARYVFDGEVKSVHPGAADGKVLRLTRFDTGKTVSLTQDDLNNHSLTMID